MIADYLRNVEHSVVVFEDISTDNELSKLIYEKAIAWMSRSGCSPSLMGTNHDNGKYLRFENSERTLLKHGFDSLTHFDMVSLRDDVDSHLHGRKCSIHFSSRPHYNKLVIDFETGTMDLESDRFVTISHDACQTLTPTYGIGYRRQFGFGPVLYALNISYGPLPLGSKESLRISHWAAACRHSLFKVGLLRDVYSWNFLTAPQLVRKVGGTTLENWIRDDHHRGSVATLTDKVILWGVAEEHIPEVRKVLFDADVIFDYDKHIQKPLQLFNAVLQPGDEAREFFQAWATKTLDEMIEWYLQRYGSNPPHANRMTGEQVVATLLQATGAIPNNTENLKVEEPGQLRKLTNSRSQQNPGAFGDSLRKPL